MMKFSIETAKLKGLVASVIKAVPNSTIVPVYKGILFSVKNGMLQVTCMNESTALRSASPVTGDDGEFMLDAGRVDAIVKAMNGDTVGFEDGGQFITLTCGKSEFRLLKFGSGSSFPSFLNVISDEIAVDGKVFKELIAYTNFATSKDDDGRPAIFSGIYLSLADKVLKAAGTNSHHIASYRKDIGVDGNFTIVIPADVMNDLAKLLTDDVVKLKLRGSRMLLSQNDFECALTGITGTFPPYERIIPASTRVNVKIDRKELLNALTRVALCANDAASCVKFTVNSDNLTLNAKSQEGIGEEPVDAEVTKDTDEPFVISFNSKYMVSALKTMKEDKVTLGFNQVLTPAVVKMDGKDEFLYIISAIRTVN